MGICSAVILAPRESTLPGVCSPVEAGEVARIACRSGGDLPKGLRQILRMTVNKHTAIATDKDYSIIFQCGLTNGFAYVIVMAI